MSKIYFSLELPSSDQIFRTLSEPYKRALVICDSRFKMQPFLKKWFRDPAFCFYFVKSGEHVKSVEKLSLHLKKISKLTRKVPEKEIVFISLGGGSIGDLTGFLASIYKRGVPLVHIPTTYLSAMDSAHGGKTALNFQKIKNFIGTYWFPKSIFIVKNFFKTLSKKQKESAYGELLKMSIINGGSFYKILKNHYLDRPIDFFIKKSINLKMKIVRKDPYEKKSIRRKLNLGHTVGHIFESALSLPHGLAISYGLLFSMRWSLKKGFLNKKLFKEMRGLLLLKPKKMKSAQFIKLLQKDKKYKSKKAIDFIFIEKPGKVFVKSVSEKEIVNEAKRQGII